MPRHCLSLGILVSSATDKVVITGFDIEQGQIEPIGSPSKELVRAHAPRWWEAALLCPLVFCLPVLCLVSLVTRVLLRNREASLRARWDRFLCASLIASGLLTSALFCLYEAIYVDAPAPFGPIAPTPLAFTDPLPQFPSSGILTAEDIASNCKPLVFIVAPNSRLASSRNYLEIAPIGAAVLLLANDGGYLLGTSRHLVEGSGITKFANVNNEMLVCSHNRNCAIAHVLGRNENADLALLWVPGAKRTISFRQPIADRAGIHTGQQVFVIGHPQRLFFTLSSGLVSRAEDSTLLQFSAPVSPGNSGGPMYDARGNLLGIVMAMVDRERNPNAENLNFAVRADLFLDVKGWRFDGPEKREWEHFTTLELGSKSAKGD